MPRFFVGSDQIKDNKISVRGIDVNHIKNVLRMKSGDEVEICNGKGTDYRCTVESLDRDEVLLNIEDSYPSDTELPKKLYLFQGLPKSDKMELIIQKAVELGVYEIIPTVTKRCIVKIDAKKEDKKITRWQQIAEAAAKQSGRGIIPEIKAPMSLKDALTYSQRLDLVLVPYEKAEGIEATRNIISDLDEINSVGVFIGPEGGFEEGEIEQAQGNGAKAISLGKRILRTETAGLAILSVLMMNTEK